MDEVVGIADNNTFQAIVLRIVSQQQILSDLRVDHHVNFHSLLEVLESFVESGEVTSFDYEDEDGDRITVRSDEELNTMITWHQWNCSRLCNGGTDVYPLAIYPKVGRTSSRRNTLGLTVEIHTPSTPSPRVSGGSNSSGRKCPEDIQAILSSGQIKPQDLQYLSVIGNGNGGSVHKAFHRPSQRTIAVKVIALDIAEEVQRQILSELDILFQCHSDFIVAFHGAFFTESSKICLCMELMDGNSLDKYGQLPKNVLARVAVMVVKGLQYLWSLKIMHRDVKPNNMLVNRQGQVKLCDFGVSIQLVHSIAKTYVGTNAYMAPERIMGDEYGIYSDVWSLGLSLVEMSTGEFPYPPNAINKEQVLPPIELLQCIVNENPPSLSTELFGDALRDFVEICLKKNPQERPNPEQLSRHPYIVQNDTANQNIIVAEFIDKFHTNV